MIEVIIAAAIVGAAGYFVYKFIKDRRAPYVYIKEAPATPELSFEYSSNLTGPLGTGFIFPNTDGPHYVTKMAGPLGIMSLKFSIEGDGKLVPTDSDPPARVRLFMQRRGDTLSGAGEYEHYRWWSHDVALFGPGDYELSVDMRDGANWTSVFGKAGNTVQTSFDAALKDLVKVGFTFGGSFAGHGVYCKEGGPVTFTLKDFSIG